MKQDRIVILDLGSRDSTATARAIRALGVYSEIYPHDLTLAQLRALDNVRGVILNPRGYCENIFCRQINTGTFK